MTQATTPTSNRLTVLLADEQEAWQQVVRSLLEPMGVETVSVRTGRQALEVLEGREVHVAVLDMAMPQLGGLQVIKLVREHKKFAPPSILLAQHLTNAMLHEALGMNIFSVLSKPVDFNVLLDSLARVVKRHYENRWPM